MEWFEAISTFALKPGDGIRAPKVVGLCSVNVAHGKSGSGRTYQIPVLAAGMKKQKGWESKIGEVTLYSLDLATY